MQKHEADFVLSYKDHMMQVQLEMAEFKKKSSDFYLNLKKSEKVRMLEGALGLFREECTKLAASYGTLKEKSKAMASELTFVNEEIKSWRDEAKTLKFQNVLLRNTINQLKSPQLIGKYEERGRQLAEQEFKRLLAKQKNIRSSGSEVNGKSQIILSGEA